MNSGNMLEMMPEVQASDKVLAALHDSLEIELDTMMTRFRNNYNNALKAVNEGTMTKIKQAEVEKELQDEQARIAEYQKQAQLVVGQRRQKLLAPVIDKLNAAIIEVGKEKGYSFIFDVSSGGMLYVNKSEDVSSLVASKLGLKLDDKN
ncbi:MAG TPA: OmpH family outer membrane protein [Saprospiraceae bacterium]|nr:OmpH family outer membrane protein [Candidatus Parvibacillus calidus]MBX2937854.1 OmpH family outer membrane protein [Saprospiraceae bacterium]MBX7179019.1 OmpH family outer membrane protein [Saprospiraceae bacterium]MCC7149894.1 OmpH family outer membrane protein [Saprospiraceae bacterium]MCO6471643.1 OmpH family outer membrane protein [Saprospiraceae bacterium]